VHFKFGAADFREVVSIHLVNYVLLDHFPEVAPSVESTQPDALIGRCPVPALNQSCVINVLFKLITGTALHPPHIWVIAFRLGGLHVIK
jgi:hypothetical protein